MIEQFKSTHKQLEGMKSKGFTTSEIRKDIAAMEQEQESVTRKIEKLKRQVSLSFNDFQKISTR
jgi:intraflagellar transport protein 81